MFLSCALQSSPNFYPHTISSHFHRFFSLSSPDRHHLRETIKKNFDTHYDSVSPLLSHFFFLNYLRLSPLKHPLYRWLNARRDERAECGISRGPFFHSLGINSVRAVLSTLLPFLFTCTHASHICLSHSLVRSTFPRKFSSISRVGYILFRSTFRAPVIPVSPTLCSNRFVG